jgi:uncharacterized membrane protein YcaP (DUF421 family)
MQQPPVDFWHALYINLVDLGNSPQAVSVAEKIIRPVAIYLFLVVALKLIGRRILAQLNPFDLVVLLTLSNTVQNAIIGNDTSLSGGLIGAVALLAVNAVLVRVYYRGPKFEHRMMAETDTCLIQNHQLQFDELRKLRINIGELTERAHERGFDDLTEVETAVIYPNGTIYMKGQSQDSARIEEILREINALTRELAARRG